MAASLPISRVLVVGSGVIGLRTAVELTRRKIPVVLRSPVPPCHPSGVCSPGAGGLWMPFHCDDPRTDRWANETLDELLLLVQQQQQQQLVEVVPTVTLKRYHTGPTTADFVHPDYHLGTGGSSGLPSWSKDPRLHFQHLTVEMLSWQNNHTTTTQHPLRIPSQGILQQAGYHFAWFFQAPIVDTPNMLEHMLQELRDSSTATVDVETGTYYQSLDELLDEAKYLGCNGVVNCTGLGAATLCGDDQLVGARGILLHYDRATCVRTADQAGQTRDAIVLAEEGPWGSEELPCYLIARGDTIVVGGSYLENDREPTIRDHERKRLLENAALLGIDTKACQPKGEWVGFRPYRPTSRCEVDEQVSTENIRLVHSYGYGGSGWTVYVGCAMEATNLLLGGPSSS